MASDLDGGFKVKRATKILLLWAAIYTVFFKRGRHTHTLWNLFDAVKRLFAVYNGEG